MRLKLVSSLLSTLTTSASRPPHPRVPIHPRHLLPSPSLNPNFRSSSRFFASSPTPDKGGGGSVKDPSKDINFNPKRVLILTKLSRYEFEKLRHPTLANEAELEGILRKRGSDYNTLLYHHYIHKGCEFRVLKAFQDFGVETRLVNRFNYTQENIDWADLIVTTGGDGTFLMAACRIQDRQKPIVGFNTDPTRSIGYLCLPKKYSISVQDAVNKLFQNKFKWTLRRRIRITLIGENVYDAPVELHDQQLSQPEYRFFECLQERPQITPLTVSEENLKNSKLQKRTLPVLALNEVYLGECVSARVSYFEVSTSSTPSGDRIKTKNAGICVSTGTGSTSWSHNISKISPQTVRELLQIVDESLKVELGRNSNPVLHQLTSGLGPLAVSSMVDRVTGEYNDALTFRPESDQMLYTIRDPVSHSTLPCASTIEPRGFAQKMEIKSRCFDACMVIDGGLSFSFNDGTMVIFEMFEEDALKTVVELGDEDDQDQENNGHAPNGNGRSFGV